MFKDLENISSNLEHAIFLNLPHGDVLFSFLSPTIWLFQLQSVCSILVVPLLQQDGFYQSDKMLRCHAETWRDPDVKLYIVTIVTKCSGHLSDFPEVDSCDLHLWSPMHSSNSKQFRDWWHLQGGYWENAGRIGVAVLQQYAPCNQMATATLVPTLNTHACEHVRSRHVVPFLRQRTRSCPSLLAVPNVPLATQQRQLLCCCGAILNLPRCKLEMWKRIQSEIRLVILLFGHFGICEGDASKELSQWSLLARNRSVHSRSLPCANCGLLAATWPVAWCITTGHRYTVYNSIHCNTSHIYIYMLLYIIYNI